MYLVSSNDEVFIFNKLKEDIKMNTILSNIESKKLLEYGRKKVVVNLSIVNNKNLLYNM